MLEVFGVGPDAESVYLAVLEAPGEDVGHLAHAAPLVECCPFDHGDKRYTAVSRTSGLGGSERLADAGRDAGDDRLELVLGDDERRRDLQCDSPQGA